ncbi:MAG: ribosome maturation factor RimM [Gammaproteobacteria bacterium]|nr:ribosome maturation factor RimM [Gammaproteobacteria bacterium]
MSDWVVVGKVSGVYGVRGWVRIFSYTAPRENILTYSPWYLKREAGSEMTRVIAGRVHGKGVVAQLEFSTDRDVAAQLVGLEIVIKSEQLPPVEQGEYYWSDLVGLEVVTVDGQILGKVDHLIETGANDVLVVKGERERLLPYTDECVLKVSLDDGVIQVDWDPDF